MTLWKWLIALGVLLAIAIAGLFLAARAVTADARQEYRAREAELRPLLQSHATREQVVQALRVQFVDYSRDSTNRWVIEQRVSSRGVHQRAERYPGVLFHTTMHWMTWLFFDAEGRLQDYYLCPQ